MESLTSKEFFDQLNSNTLKPCFSLIGIVKKSDKDSEVLFAKKGDFSHWVKIPSTMIEKVNVLKVFSKEDKTLAVVKLHLKAPATPEGKLFYELLSSLAGEGEDWKHKSMGGGCNCGHGGGMGEHHCCGGGMEHFGEHHCTCGCHHNEEGKACFCHNCGCQYSYPKQFGGSCQK